MAQRTVSLVHPAFVPVLSNRLIEGPTHRQAVRMASRRRELLAAARAAEAAGNDDRAFTLDCEAWDVEADLKRYGFSVETGRPVRRAAQ